MPSPSSAPSASPAGRRQLRPPLAAAARPGAMPNSAPGASSAQRVPYRSPAALTAQASSAQSANAPHVQIEACLFTFLSPLRFGFFLCKFSIPCFVPA